MTWQVHFVTMGADGKRALDCVDLPDELVALQFLDILRQTSVCVAASVEPLDSGGR